MKAHKKEKKKDIKSNEIIYIYTNSSIWSVSCNTLHQWDDAEVEKNIFFATEETKCMSLMPK